MIYRKKIYPLDARSALIAKRQFLDFYTFVMNIRDYDNITVPRHIPNNLFIQSLSAYIIETDNGKLCKETFGTIDYSALTKVRDEISAKAAGVIHVSGDDEIIYNVNNKIMAIFNEKELLEDAGLLKVKVGKAESKTRKIVFRMPKPQGLIEDIRQWIAGTEVVKGKKGCAKRVIIPLLYCVKRKLMVRPSYNEAVTTFPELKKKIGESTFKYHFGKEQPLDKKEMGECDKKFEKYRK